jgi:hypothetical protein
MSPYLAARAMIRQGTLGGANAQGDPAALARARDALHAIMTDRALLETHQPAASLLGFVMARLDPAAALTEVARGLTMPEGDAKAFEQRLRDFEILLDHFLERTDPDAARTDLSRLRESNELADWVLTFQQSGEDAMAHALARWDQTRSDRWLMVTLTMMPSGHARQSEMLAAAAAVGESSPAYPTLAFHQARLLLLAGDVNSARSVLARAIAAPGMPVSSVNLFKAARLLTARTLDDFLADAVRQPVDEDSPAIGQPLDPSDREPTFDRDAIDVLNERMPMSMLLDVGRRTAIPRTLRHNIVLAVFTRAVLLRDVAAVRAALPEAAAVEPTLRLALKPLQDTSDDRMLLSEGALILLAHPGMRPFVESGSDPAPRSAPAARWINCRSRRSMACGTTGGAISARPTWGWCRTKRSTGDAGLVWRRPSRCFGSGPTISRSPVS